MNQGMPDFAFRMMAATMAVEDFLFPRLDQRVLGFGLQPGMTVVDYGCGPGRYTTRFAKLVGPGGRVHAVDIHPIAIEMVKEKVIRLGLGNVTPVLAQGYNSGLPNALADRVCALDMFFALPEPGAFLQEAHRICKPNGLLILDDGHETRARTLEKVRSSGLWKVVEESKDHLKLAPEPGS